MSASRSTDRPRILPSASAAILIRCHWSRPWCTVMLPSLRDSVHLTGLPTLRATSTASTSSAVTCSLEPKPPPTSGAMTRRFCSGMPKNSGQHEPQHVRDLGRRPERDLVADPLARRPRAAPSRTGSAAAAGSCARSRPARRGTRRPRRRWRRPTRSSCCRPRAPSASPRPARSACRAPAAAARSRRRPRPARRPPRTGPARRRRRPPRRRSGPRRPPSAGAAGSRCPG